MRRCCMLEKHSSDGNKKIAADFLLTKDQEKISFTLKGQQAKALIALINEKERGCTALEVSCWAYRFAAYIHKLKTRHHLNILTVKEPHKNGSGWHGRYFLLDDVVILKTSPNGQ